MNARAMLVGLGLASLAIPAEAGAPPARAGRRWALVVNALDANRGVTSALQQMLELQYAFGPGSLVVLNGRDATRERIYMEMKRIRGALHPYDSLLVVFSMEQRADVRGAAPAWIPADGNPKEPWSWIGASDVFGWLSQLQLGSGLILYPGCPRPEDRLPTDLAYGRNPGAIDIVRVCEFASMKQQQTLPDVATSGHALGHFMNSLVRVLGSIAEAHQPVSTPAFVSRLEQQIGDSTVSRRRFPEWVSEGYVFEPAGKGARADADRYRAAATNDEREIVLRGIPGILRSSGAGPEETRNAVAFLRNVAISPTAGLVGAVGPPALALRTAAIETLAEMRSDPARDALLAVVQQATDAGAALIRQAAITQLSRMSLRPADLTVLHAAFGDPDATVRETAVRTAVVLGDKSAVDALTTQLKRETELSVRAALIQAISALGGRDPDALIQLLDNKEPSIRREAATALGRLTPDVGAMAALLKHLREDPDDDVRRQCAYAVGRMWVRTANATAFVEAPGVLQSALKRGPSQVREAAAFALGSIAQQGTGEDLSNAERALRQLLLNEDATESERVAAADALGQFKSEAAIDDLIKVLKDKEYRYPGLRRAAAAALGAIGIPSEKVVDALVGALKDKEPFVQRQAQQSLDQLPFQSEAVIRALDNPSPSVRLSAVRRLEQFQNKSTVGPLIRMLGDADPEVRQAAGNVLRAFRDPASIAQIAQAAKGNGSLLQFNALAVLAGIPEPAAIQAVAEVARTTQDVAVRVDSLGALRAQIELFGRATTGSPSDRQQALASAKSLAIDASKDDSTAVRKEAVTVLGVLPDGRARLEEVAKTDTSPDVRAAAIEQLRRRP